MYAAFQKALWKYSSREIDDFDVILFQIYCSMYMYVPISLSCSFLPHSVVDIRQGRSYSWGKRGTRLSAKI